MIYLDDLSKKALEEEFSKIGEKPFRGRQIYKWMYSKGVFDFSKMTDLSKNLREKLISGFAFREIEVTDVLESSADHSVKLLLKLNDGNRIESVILRDGERITGCLSTQVGCRMGCTFCGTSKVGLKRNLEVGEIVRQIIIMNEILSRHEEKLTNIVFMGMGEPLDNLYNLKEAIEIILDGNGLNFSHRKVTISTCGMSDELQWVFDKLSTPVNIAVSINFPDNSMRRKYMPVTVKYPLENLINTLKKLPVQKRKRITIEYVLIKGVNDSINDAKKLSKLLKGLSVKINLIVYNSGGTGFVGSDEDDVIGFQNVLLSDGYGAFIRKSFGSDIEGACGQLYAQYETEESQASYL